MESIIELHGVSKTFTDPGNAPTHALHEVSLLIRPGEWFVILGPSGSGKSTLLRIMSGLEVPSKGQVRTAQGSFVFQQFALFPWMTVAQNVAVGLGTDRGRGVGSAKVSRELKRFGLSRFASVRPRALSGGMRQRVGLARAMVADRPVIFMDEPFSELDSFTAQELRKEFLTIWKERRPTVVMVTHLIDEAIELADRIAVLTPRPGRLEAVVENTLPRPRDRRSKPFFDLEDRLFETVRP